MWAGLRLTPGNNILLWIHQPKTCCGLWLVTGAQWFHRLSPSAGLWLNSGIEPLCCVLVRRWMKGRNRKSDERREWKSCAQLIYVAIECTVIRLHRSDPLATTWKHTLSRSAGGVYSLTKLTCKNLMSVCWVLATSWITHALYFKGVISLVPVCSNSVVIWLLPELPICNIITLMTWALSMSWITRADCKQVFVWVFRRCGKSCLLGCHGDGFLFIRWSVNHLHDHRARSAVDEGHEFKLKAPCGRCFNNNPFLSQTKLTSYSSAPTKLNWLSSPVVTDWNTTTTTRNRFLLKHHVNNWRRQHRTSTHTRRHVTQTWC